MYVAALEELVSVYIHNKKCNVDVCKDSSTINHRYNTAKQVERCVCLSQLHKA